MLVAWICLHFWVFFVCSWIDEDCLLLQNDSSTCPYYWYEQPYLEYLRHNHPELLIPSTPAEEVQSVPAAAAEEVNGDLALQILQLKLQQSEMKAQLGEVMVKIMEAKEEIKKEIAKGNKSAPVFSCHIS